MAKVLVVHNCEEPGNWHENGSKYQGGLGWLHATWLEFKVPSDPLNMAAASIEEQARAMVRFATKYGWPTDSPGHCIGY
jgi:hypothetical protein